MASIDAIKRRLRWAAIQDGSLHEQVGPFLQGERDKVVHEIDEQAGEHRWVFKGDPLEVPPDFSHQVGGILYYFRSTLDHIVWQLVLANEKIPGTNNAFPIFLRTTDYEKRSKTPLRGVTSTAKAIIKGLQSCYGGNPALWRLNQLCNIDKHRYQHLTVTQMTHIQRISGSSGPNEPPIGSGVRIDFRPLVRDAVLATHSYPPVHVQFNLALQIGFSERTPGVSDLYVMQTLSSIYLAVDEVISKLEGELT